MILKYVRYLAQQGYRSDKLVVLIPYLGQLRLLRDQFAEDNDPILNNLDRFDLVKTGLVMDTASKSTKLSLRLSIIGMLGGFNSYPFLFASLLLQAGIRAAVFNIY
jgi:hypothetical protein